MLAGILGLQTARVERGLMLFLAVLVEVGAALGLYFATGHVRSDLRRRGRGAMIEGGTLTVLPQGKPRAAVRQIAPATRRVPRLKQWLRNELGQQRKEEPWAMWCRS